MKKKKISFSPFQGRQMMEAVLEMLMADPELFNRMPGVTPEQREAYEGKRQRMQWMESRTASPEGT